MESDVRVDVSRFHVHNLEIHVTTALVSKNAFAIFYNLHFNYDMEISWKHHGHLQKLTQRRQSNTEGAHTGRRRELTLPFP